MRKPLTAWSRTVALVPYSGVQFLDFGFNLDDTRRLGRSFIERPDRSLTLPDGSYRLRFIPLTGDDEQDAPILAQSVADEAQYDINKVKALEPFLNKWVPVPYLRVRPGRGDYRRGAARHRARQLGARAGDPARRPRGAEGASATASSSRSTPRSRSARPTAPTSCRRSRTPRTSRSSASPGGPRR